MRFLGKLLASHLSVLSDMTAASGFVGTKVSFLASAHRELRVALVRRPGAVCRGCASLLARAAGREILFGAEMPSVE